MVHAAPGFRRLECGPVRLVVDPAWEGAARDLGLLEPEGAARALAGGKPLAGRGRAGVLRCRGGEGLVLRPVLHGGLLGPLRRGWLLGLRRPQAELAVTATLRAAGAPVPEPVLLVGQRRAGPLWTAYLGTRHEEGTEDAYAFLARRPAPAALLAAARAAGRAVRRFHDAGGVHADLHVKNLLLRASDDGFEVLVIDLDRARAGRPAGPARRMAELGRLHRSLVKRDLLGHLGPRAIAAFFGAYAGGDRRLRRELRRRLPRERLRLRVHRLHY